jgi:hypothetical protein
VVFIIQEGEFIILHSNESPDLTSRSFHTHLILRVSKTALLTTWSK